MFDDACIKDFECLEECFTSAPFIVSLDQSLPFKVMCDTSGVTLVAILGEQCENILLPLYYAYKVLNTAQKNYTVTEPELLMVDFSSEKFLFYLIVT